MDGQEIFDKRNLARWARSTDQIGATGRQVLEHSARTAVTAVASMLAARLFSLPEIYWAPITTLVITQSSLGSALAISWQRFIGTALGAAVGAIVASYFGPDLLPFGVGVFLLGILCTGVRADRTAFRFGGVTLAIVLMFPRVEPAWRVAFDRFSEVSIGIAVALAMTVVWPERDATTKDHKG